MPDFTLCTNNECPLGSVCRRLQTVSDSQYQSYSYFEPKLNDNKKIDCDYFYYFMEIPNNDLKCRQ